MSYFGAALRAPEHVLLITTFIAPFWIFSLGNDLNISSVNSMLKLLLQLSQVHIHYLSLHSTCVGQVDVMLRPFAQDSAKTCWLKTIASILCNATVQVALPAKIISMANLCSLDR